MLLLSASPWAEIDKIVDQKNQQSIMLNEDDRSTPARIPLAPGKYSVTMSGPAGVKQTIDVQIDGGRATERKIDTGSVNFDELEKEVSNQ